MLLHQLIEVSIGLGRGVEGGKSKANRAAMGRAQCRERGFGERSVSLLYVGLDTLLGALGSDDDIVAAVLLGRPAEVAWLIFCRSIGRSIYLLFFTEELVCHFDRRCESCLVVLLRLDFVPPREKRKDGDDDGSCIAQRTLGEAQGDIAAVLLARECLSDAGSLRQCGKRKGCIAVSAGACSEGGAIWREAEVPFTGELELSDA